MHEIENPILRGFNPDPSILRVGSEYYIAASTFEWAPGIQLHRSRDLEHWEPLGGALRRPSQLDLRGYPASAGVWAPNLSHIGGRFYLAYTLLPTTGPLKDTHNYFVWTDDIDGAWSEPMYLDSHGFDPSLFEDEEGRTWLVGMTWDYRKDRNHFAGISIREISLPDGKFLGPYRTIFRGTSLGRTEGPHLYRKDGWYYLLTAEGGTEFGHAVTIARSRSIEGTYEIHPDNPILTSRGDLNLELQRAGHGDLFDTPEGEWYMVHLASRPLPPHARSVLGRETCLQKIEWRPGDWPRLWGGGTAPRMKVPGPLIPAVSGLITPRATAPVPAARDGFDSPRLDPRWMTLRVHADESWLSLSARPGFLRLKGREGLSSRFLQSLVARRLDALSGRAETCLEFEPGDFRHMAGLVLWYDTTNYYYLRVSRDEEKGTCIGIILADNGEIDQPVPDLPIPEGSPIYLRAELDAANLAFSWSPDGLSWTPVGPILDASTLSDEYPGEGRFTGAMIGLCCQDMAGTGRFADFDYFEWQVR